MLEVRRQPETPAADMTNVTRASNTSIGDHSQ
jgi:hypothetical protein